MYRCYSHDVVDHILWNVFFCILGHKKNPVGFFWIKFGIISYYIIIANERTLFKLGHTTILDMTLLKMCLQFEPEKHNVCYSSFLAEIWFDETSRQLHKRVCTQRVHEM